MRILMLTPGTGHFLCGSCMRDNSLGRALIAEGHDVTVTPLYLPFFLEDEGEESEVHMGGINMYLRQRMPWTERLPRFLANLLDRPGLLRWAAARGNMTDASGLGEMTLSMLRGEEGRQRGELDKLIDWMGDQERPDVICLSNVMLVGLVHRLKEAFGVPIVCSMQGEAPFLDSLPETHRAAAWDEITQRSRKVDAFVPVSRSYGEELRGRLDLPASKVHVVHNGIELGDFAETAAPAGPTVGYLARMCADKGLPTLVDAFIRLRVRIPEARLVVCGVVLREDRPLVAELKGRLAKAGCAEAATFLPNASKERKHEFLRSLSVLSVPATYGESFGLYVLEALASGVPVVQPRHGSFEELIEATGGGRLSDPDDSVSLCNELELLLTDEEARLEHARAGRKAVHERFGSDRMAREFADVCRMLARV